MCSCPRPLASQVGGQVKDNSEQVCLTSCPSSQHDGKATEQDSRRMARMPAADECWGLEARMPKVLPILNHKTLTSSRGTTTDGHRDIHVSWKQAQPYKHAGATLALVEWAALDFRALPPALALVSVSFPCAQLTPFLCPKLHYWTIRLEFWAWSPVTMVFTVREDSLGTLNGPKVCLQCYFAHHPRITKVKTHTEAQYLRALSKECHLLLLSSNLSGSFTIDSFGMVSIAFKITQWDPFL